jgi:branched-chain amino acid transport system ATP-binding protein
VREPTGPPAGASGEPLLEVDAVSVRFGAIQALDRVSLEIQRGEIVAIIGPNGAGKTTLLNVVSGFYHPSEGQIRFEGRDRTRLRPYDVAALGVARTFQNVALFKGMSVLDNIMTGRLLKMRGSFLLEALYWGPAMRQELEHRAFVERIIDFLEIEAIRKAGAGTLPYGTTIALIEHDMSVVMDISDRVIALDYGRKIADGRPAEVRADQGVIAAYLGVSHA